VADKKNGNMGILVMAGLGIAAFLLMQGDEEEKGTGTGNGGIAVGTGSGGSTEIPQGIAVNQQNQAVMVDVDEVNKPSVADLRWYLLVKANMKPGYGSNEIEGVSSPYLRIADWDYWAKDQGVNLGGSSQKVTLDEYVQLALNVGEVT
jgi:hypothetical protein